jgi:hypothetical protein
LIKKEERDIKKDKQTKQEHDLTIQLSIKSKCNQERLWMGRIKIKNKRKNRIRGML